MRSTNYNTICFSMRLFPNRNSRRKITKFTFQISFKNVAGYFCRCLFHTPLSIITFCTKSYVTDLLLLNIPIKSVIESLVSCNMPYFSCSLYFHCYFTRLKARIFPYKKLKKYLPYCTQHCAITNTYL